MKSDKPLLLITGVNGYIGLWVTLKALESNRFRVRGTVRDTSNEDKIQTLRFALGDKFEDLELFSADLTDKEAMKRAVEGCEYVLHVASPNPTSNNLDEDSIINPAIEGTLTILEAAIGSSVKRIVTTSSTAAILDATVGDADIDESHWPSLTKDTTPYIKSKILAEQKAWEFLDSLPEEKRTFEYVALCPGLVVGPFLAKTTCFSQETISSILTGKMARLPQMYVPVVDVRDVADAHINALTAKGDERYALTEGTYSVKDLSLMIEKDFKGFGYKVATKELCTTLAWLLKNFNKDLKFFYSFWKHRCHIKNDKAVEELGIEFRNISESINEMIYSMIELGMVEDKTKI